MKYLLFIPLLFSMTFAWPAGTTKTMRVIVNSSSVNETATNFVHQLNLSDSIAKIDNMIDSTKNVTIALPDGTTLKPKDIVYIPGKRFLIYWDGSKHTTVNDTFYICFGINMNIVNSTSVYSNNSVVHKWGTDKFSGNTYYDYVGSRNGTGTSIDTVASVFGVGMNFNAGTDQINAGYGTVLSNKTNLTISGVFKITSTTGNQRLFTCYKNTTEKVYLYFDNVNLYASVGGSHYGQLSRSGNISTNTNYHFAMTYNGTALKLYINGVEKTLTNVGSVPASTGDLSTTDMLMGYYTTSDAFTGVIDEVCIMSATRSSGAILDKYRSLFEPATFYSIGSITKVKKSTGNKKRQLGLNMIF